MKKLLLVVSLLSTVSFVTSALAATHTVDMKKTPLITMTVTDKKVTFEGVSRKNGPFSVTYKKQKSDKAACFFKVKTKLKGTLYFCDGGTVHRGSDKRYGNWN